MKLNVVVGCLLSMVSSAAFAAPGVRVAQLGSPTTPFVSSAKTPRNSMQTTALSYERHSITTDSKTAAGTTSVDHVKTDFVTYPADLSFTGYLGEKFVLRLKAIYKEADQSTGFLDANNVSISARVKAAGALGFGYLINPSFEVGGRLLIRRHFVEVPNGNQKNEYTSGLYIFGPSMVFALGLSPSMNLEIDAFAGYATGSDESKPAQGTTTKSDTSGFVFESNANAVIAASNDIDFLAGLGIAYTNITGKAGTNEETNKDFQLLVNLASVRFKF